MTHRPTHNRRARLVLGAFLAVCLLLVLAGCVRPAALVRRALSRRTHVAAEPTASMPPTTPPPAPDARQLAQDQWPAAFMPADKTQWSGASAAWHLLDWPTRYETVSTQPDWAKAYNGIVNGVATNQKVVALTFDDGPTQHTATICDELSSFGDSATFFWVGSRVTTPAVQYALAHNDELANHTWNHPNMQKLSSAEASAELGLTSARIAQLSGQPPLWFRSPFNRLFTREYAQVKAHHLLYANYSITSIDWMKGMTPAGIVSKIAQGLHPGGVILMHDSPDHNPTEWLPNVLLMLKARGYRGVTMSQLAQMGTPVQERPRFGMIGLPY